MIWGKSRGLDEPYPLIHHLADTAAAAEALWDQHVTSGQRAWLSQQLDTSEHDTGRIVALAAGYHDLGKACPAFQSELRPGEDGYLGHATASYLAVPTLLGALPRGPVTRSVAYRLGELLGGHHGVFPSPRARDVEQPVRRVSALGGAVWHTPRVEIAEQVRDLLGRPELPPRLPFEAATMLAGLVMLADWVASDTALIRALQRTAPTSLGQRHTTVQALMQDRIVDLGLCVPHTATHLDMGSVWGVEANPLQRSISDEFHPTSAGLLTITASTGYGKTEAGLLAAHRLGRVTGRPGVFVGLPTMATADQMHIRLDGYRGVVSPEASVTLAHSMAGYNQDYSTAPGVTDWLRQRGGNRPLLAPMAAGTIDQALAAALATRNNMVRLHALSGKTLVIDEAHDYDPYMQAVLGRLLAWCGHLGVPVVLLSATLPRHVHAALTREYLDGAGIAPLDPTPAPYPGWNFTSITGGEQRPTGSALRGMRTHGSRIARIEHRPHHPVNVTNPAPDEQDARWAAAREYVQQAAAEGGCVAVISNTVASAQRLYRQLRAELDGNDIPVWLLHSRFPQHRRREITRDITSRFGKGGDRPHTGIVVATQIIEQSLDVDFDVLISDLAPIALLIQRLGRCHRHDRDKRPGWCTTPTIVVLDPIHPNATQPVPYAWAGIYPEYELLATHRLLATRDSQLRVPDDVDALVQHVHHQGLPDVDEPDVQRHHQRSATAQQHAHQARTVTIPRPGQVHHLEQMSIAADADADSTTRLGVDTARVIPCFTAADGTHWLDADHTVEFPSGRPTSAQQHRLIDASITVPSTDTPGLEAAPDTWHRVPTVRDAHILPAPHHGHLHLDSELGLVKE